MPGLTWTNETRRLGDLIPWSRNPRQIRKAEAERLAQSLDEFGQIHPIAIAPDGTILDGHQRQQVWSASRQFWPEYQVDVRVASRPLTEHEHQKRVAMLHAGTVGGWDWDALASWDMGDLSEWGFDGELLKAWNDDAANLALMLEADAEGGDGGGGDAKDDDRFELYVPDAVFASDNEWDVPTLKADLQANFLEMPFVKWGDGPRTQRMRGTYHFYTEDYKFEALWDDPLNLVNSQCVAIVEPNTSTNEQMPAAVGLWRIYCKRWMARYMQEFGVKVWVDLDVAPKFRPLNLLGVPQGWLSYATRGLDRRIDRIEAEYAQAVERAGQEPRFLVYGGGKATEELCKGRGWLWLPENMRVKEGRAEADYG
jgi:hypothetical protein